MKFVELFGMPGTGKTFAINILKNKSYKKKERKVFPWIMEEQGVLCDNREGDDYIEVEILYIFVKVFVFDGYVQYFTVIFCLLGGFKWWLFFKDFCPQPDFLLFLMWCASASAWCVP